jgi:predicted AAA+ superfamily ATPase
MKRALTAELISWKNRSEHLPILLRGARQVGKSYLVEEFGREHFDDVAEVDFENRPELKSAFNTRNPREILAGLELALGKPLIEGKTLLFLDEIQHCPEALIALRYFKEKMPKLHVIAAGSLLEFILNHESFGFPVGRIDFLYLHPLSFQEYLEAASPFVLQRINEYSLTKIPTPFEHEELLKWVRRYFFIGGMPAAVKASLESESLLEPQRVHYRILQAYESDFGKYARHTQQKYLQMIFQKAPVLVSQILKYSHIDKEVRSRELKEAIELLCHAGLFQRVFATTAAGLPLHAHQKKDRFKLLYLDIGLLQTATKVDAEHFFEQDIMQINAGMLAEQFVGQELMAYAPSYQNNPLLFWEKTGSGLAEVDFIIEFGSDMIPIEVKAGSTGTLRSLHSFIQGKKGRLGVRISELPLSLYNNILSVPFYMVGSLNRLISMALELLGRG